MIPGLSGVWQQPEEEVSGVTFTAIQALLQCQHHGLTAQAGLSLTAVMLHPIICLIADMKQLTVCRGCCGGGGKRCPMGSIVNSYKPTYTQREWHCLSLCVSLVSLLSLFLPSLSSAMLTDCASGVGEYEGCTIILGSHKSTGCNSQAIYYYSLSAYKCG